MSSVTHHLVRWPAAILAATVLAGSVEARPLEKPVPAGPTTAPAGEDAVGASPHDTHETHDTRSAVPALPYMRSADVPGRSVSLEVAARRFVGASGPKVTLVGVAHVAEESLYRQLQDLLDAHDVVLYESVMPAGAGGAGGTTHTERVASTVSAMRLTGGVIELHRGEQGRYPADLASLNEFAGRRDARLSQWLTAAATDAWGCPVAYSVDEDGRRYVLTSLGADGRPGGDGADGDLEVTNDTLPRPGLQLVEGDNLQSELAAALGLTFQLDGIDYDRPNFRCSDMSMDQLQRAMLAEGLDMGPLEGSLAGSSLPGRIAVFFLRLIRTFDIFVDGMIADALKLILIELFSDEAFLEQSIRQVGEGFERVLIDQRNQVVMDDLRAIVQREHDVKSVAIFYGAAHMPDLAERLAEQLGYQPDGEQWFTAFEVDLTKTVLSPAQVQSLRVMIRRQLHMMGN